MSERALVDVEGKEYPATGRVLGRVRIEIGRGEFASVLGPSGCGKTTLLRIVLGLDTAYRGRVVVNGKDVTGPGLDRGVVFQEPRLLPWMSVRQNVEFALPPWSGADGRERARRLIQTVGLGGFEDVWPRQLSGGMAQRAALARALVNVPRLLVLDEPFGALDSLTRLAMQRELADVLAREGTETLMVTHDVDEAVYLSDWIVILTPRPATVAAVVEVPLPRPRRRADRAYVELRSTVLEHLYVEH